MDQGRRSTPGLLSGARIRGVQPGRAEGAAPIGSVLSVGCSSARVADWSAARRHRPGLRPPQQRRSRWRRRLRMGVECGQDQAGAPSRVGRVMERRPFFPVQPGRSCHTHTSTHGHTHVCAHAMHTCTHVRTQAHMCAHTYTHACTHARMYAHAVHTWAHWHTCTHTCAHRHTCAHTCTHSCVRTHTCTRTRLCLPPPPGLSLLWELPSPRRKTRWRIRRPEAPGPGAPLSSQFSVEAAGRGSLPRKRPASSCAANDLISCSPWRAAVFHSRQWDANTRRGPRIKPSEAGFLPEREIGRAVWSSDVGLRGPRGPRDSIFPVSPRR